MRKLNHRDAEFIMGVIGLLTILEITDMEDLIEVMVALEDSIISLPDNSIDQLIAILESTQQD